jgi:hypothetical protein
MKIYFVILTIFPKYFISKLGYKMVFFIHNLMRLLINYNCLFSFDLKIMDWFGKIIIIFIRFDTHFDIVIEGLAKVWTSNFI